jgi:hypothetical protein
MSVYGSQFGQVAFNVSSIRTALSGKTITGLTCTAQCQGSWYPSGANLFVGYFSDSPGGSSWTPDGNAGNVRHIASQSFGRGQTKTFTLPTQIATAILGSANGLFIGDDSTSSLNNYGHWAGGANAWTLTFYWET